MPTPIHDALRQVRDLQQAILEKQRFKGYSGRARALGGCAALAAGLLLNLPGLPATPAAHLTAWGAVFVLALAANYGALIYWFWHDPEVGRDVRRLRPALEILPILAVGGIVTAALVENQIYDLLFGVWMALYGLAQFRARQVLPRALGWVGLYYITCGAACLLWPGISFTRDAVVMGGVFFVGEFFGGLVLHCDERPLPALRGFFGLPSAPAQAEEGE